MAYPNNKHGETALAPQQQVQYNEGGGRSKWRPSRGWVKQIGEAPRPQSPVKWDAPAFPALLGGVLPPPKDIDPGMTHAAPGASIAPDSAANAYPFTTPNPQPTPQPTTGGALSTHGAVGAQGLTNSAAWNGLFPNAPGAAPQPTSVSPHASVGAVNDQPQAPNAGGSITTQYGTASVQRAAPASPNWQADIIAAHPAIGVAGSPENKAFVTAFNQHGAPERGMQTAAQVMNQLRPVTPAPAMAHDDTRGNAKLTPGMANEARRVDPYALN